VPHAEQCRKDTLVPFILENGSREVVEHLQKNSNVRVKRAEREKIRAQAMKEDQTEARMARNRDYACYMNLPDGDECRRCWQMFYEATSAKALSTSICIRKMVRFALGALRALQSNQSSQSTQSAPALPKLFLPI